MTDNKPHKLDLDLIAMVQKARMAHDADARPSEVSAVYWIEAKAEPGTQPAPTPNAGKWVIRTTVDAVDDLWSKIKAATIEGRLGYKSKVSTSPGKEQGRSDSRLIHVRTYDSHDENDVRRVGEALRRLGITGEITYRADSAPTSGGRISAESKPTEPDDEEIE